ncbi:mitochondrial endonuclease family [Schizosaccharomyces osmophilus]|uniref:Mitochondrial endonuclease family n=1 Tax=Schizosaccharomyces osmophilus TaxID=2545709 RepID=A0AAE9W6M9_9SCHI|nr:mitochondrial endonuclease family [Schizosaccharomyces osmophilus]WBW70539.1 mitochondrial endonuclease family [Schizosaccharomyces osmophilus]
MNAGKLNIRVFNQVTRLSNVQLGCRLLHSNHSSLQSYLKYLEWKNCSFKTTLVQGTLFEYLVKHILEKHGFTLKRCGGKDDRGIDLLGKFPSGSSIEAKVAVSCKSNKAAIGPKYVRELEGSLSWCPLNTLGILACLSNFTSASLKAIQVSERPLAVCRIYIDHHSSYMFQFAWNSAASIMFNDMSVRQLYNSNTLIDTSEETSLIPYKFISKVLCDSASNEDRPIPIGLFYKSKQISQLV